MPTDTTLPGFQATGYRLRRKHGKSRNGCVRCKQQRKKCDELRPSCSRCIKRTYRCHYQNHLSDGSPSEGHESTHFPAPDLPVLPESLSLVDPGTLSPDSLSNNHLSVPSPSSGGQCASVSSPSLEKERLVSNSQSAGILDATELGLLAHYLTHTSQTIPFDDLDLYALSVGVPNLAFNCKAVMSSLLALAAACKSHNIAKRAQPPLDPQNLVEIRELLALAERHHRDSLRHIQVAMQNPDSYDYVLANAALMVLYASASHSIRVHLAAMAAQCGRRLPDELFPQHSQWISFTRAAHTASTAVLNSIIDNADKSCKPATSSIIDTRSKLPSAGLCSTSVLSPQDGPSESTKRLFLPLVASTYVQAFGRLRARAESTSALLKRSALSACHYSQLHLSLETVSVLEKCATAALSPRKGNEKSETPNNQPISFNERSGVSPWVARYMVSVTSMESPQILRRIIMSFLNKAPAEYLTLVQSVLDSPSMEARAVNWITRDSPGTTEGPSLNATHLLAMDIFAHWLVLVMLLDGVWWIGGIGQWELRQVVSLIKTQNLLGQSVDAGETWWPESMYLVKRELTPKV
ncbi:Zn(II)2Cys6 transcription factor [Aspergillus alliaceus]|uniref:Zn(II)2Cys6 transcription factor n=1 Tax=Petromyces alliaceus TaxID=209559 RepID=UPI0012A5DCF1|nr:putative C6 transcription factor [Aspergillus alliaceus]KAB8229032.1 putative C6 transcription factor [Aspergillus alliaceus]